MSVLSEILQEEYDRLKATITSYEKEAAGLPKGSVVIKRIGGREYPYLQWREGKQVKSRFIKAGDLLHLKDQVNRRREYEKLIRSLYSSKKEFDRVIGKRL
ncbi:MAG: hypothetical protein LBJ91_04720 [Clostridiales Family XIII bacterium]|jgi:hypothetical protein|nr:hypothetical protein [Clostridiales Family XIII bacterium]